MTEWFEFNKAMNGRCIRFPSQDSTGFNKHKSHGIYVGTKLLMRYDIKIRFG